MRITITPPVKCEPLRCAIKDIPYGRIGFFDGAYPCYFIRMEYCERPLRFSQPNTYDSTGGVGFGAPDDGSMVTLLPEGTSITITP